MQKIILGGHLHNGEGWRGGGSGCCRLGSKIDNYTARYRLIILLHAEGTGGGVCTPVLTCLNVCIC